MLGLEDNQILGIKCDKGALFAGGVCEGIPGDWNTFAPCAAAGSLLETIAEAAKNAISGDVVLFSPACSSWDQFQNHQNRGEVLCQALKSIGRGGSGGTPNINGRTAGTQQ